MSEEYSVGYSEGYQAGWNEAMDAAPPAAQPAPVQEHEPVAWIADTKRGYNTVGYECKKVNALPHGTMLYTTPPAQPAQQEPINIAQAYAMAQVCIDLHDAIGCKWGDNVYLAIKQLKQQPAPVQPVAFEVSLVEWVGNKLMATPKTTTTPPASWMEVVTANLVREGVNKHRARELAEHFYGLAAQPAVPDAIHHTDTSETLEYIQGWNDCRAAMLEMMK